MWLVQAPPAWDAAVFVDYREVSTVWCDKGEVVYGYDAPIAHQSYEPAPPHHRLDNTQITKLLLALALAVALAGEEALKKAEGRAGSGEKVAKN